MQILSLFRPAPAAALKVEPVFSAPEAVQVARPAALGQMFSGLSDPAFLEFVRTGGQTVTPHMALKNTAVYRSVSLIASAIGSLPLNLKRVGRDGAREDAAAHELHRLLRYRPNHFQTPMQFKRLMQTRLLTRGTAYARIVWSMKRPVALIPITGEVAVKIRDDLTPEYVVTLPGGTGLRLPANEVFVLDAMSMDGTKGLSPVEMAADVIQTALNAQRAADRIFQSGMMAGGALMHKGKISPEATARLKTQMDEFRGPDNAGKWMVLEEGMEGKPWELSAKDGQLSETRDDQVEEIARVFGVPRPLLMIDDTSWGSGIEQLAILFVRFTLSPWFTLWEEAIQAKMLAPDEWGLFIPDFDERELLRGTLKDQAEFFARALGSGGHNPWMEANEVRELSGLGAREDGRGLTPAGGKPNDQTQNPAG